ncbi:MAG: hypothetical protein R2824_34055 [Saprospiraceae bacterium]
MQTQAPTRYAKEKYQTPPGTTLSCKGWTQEAALRMLLNNIDPDVAEKPEELVVYGGRGRAARNFAALDQIIRCLKELENDETLLIQSGKPVAVVPTSRSARVLISNSQLVPRWANWEHFNELERKGLMMYGQMTAGSWIYIGTRVSSRALHETFAEAHGNILGIATGNPQCYRRSWRHGWCPTTGHNHERRSMPNS